MPTHVPLDPLVLHLLALSQTAETLPPAILTRLAALASTVEPTVDSLAALTLRLQLALADHTAFQTALRALDRPLERVGLTLDPVLETLPNPAPTPASGLQPLQQTTQVILTDPQHVPPSTLQWLAGLLRLPWPPQSPQP